MIIFSFSVVLAPEFANFACLGNELRHAGSPSTKEQILKKVMWEVRTRLAGSENFPRTRENISLSSLWNLPYEILVLC